MSQLRKKRPLHCSKNRIEVLRDAWLFCDERSHLVDALCHYALR
jgi:hypothetical protein